MSWNYGTLCCCVYNVAPVLIELLGLLRVRLEMFIRSYFTGCIFVEMLIKLLIFFLFF